MCPIHNIEYQNVCDTPVCSECFLAYLETQPIAKPRTYIEPEVVEPKKASPEVMAGLKALLDLLAEGGEYIV
jgi:hypothetical protein